MFVSTPPIPALPVSALEFFLEAIPKSGQFLKFVVHLRG